VLNVLRKLISRVPWVVVFALPFLVAGAAMVGGSFLASANLAEFIDDNPGAPGAFAQTLFERPEMIRLVLLIAGAPVLALGIVALMKKPWSLPVIRYGYIAVYAAMIVYVFEVSRMTLLVRQANIKVDGEDLTGFALFGWGMKLFWFFFPLALWTAITHLYAIRSQADEVYGRAAKNVPTRGDALFNLLWSKQVRSVVGSVVIHGLFILVPFLWGMVQSVEAYRVPYGKGLADAGGGGQKKPPPPKTQAKAATRKTVKVKTRDPKKLKGVILSPTAGREGSPEDKIAQLMEDITKQTKEEYTAPRKSAGLGHGPGTKAGGLGAGGEGEGGWPNGMKNSLVRFIRLEYNGEGWDDGMDDSRADLNFLDNFGEVTGFKVATKTESMPIHKLKLFRKGEAPPFVFMKGESHIGSIPPGDINTLRTYLQGGGMIFADAGSASWGADFENFISRVLPDQPLIDIADDDGIYQAPYPFPNGAPPMWHHAGSRAKGCKYQGRWCVFYHPGDISDAWKTGNDGLTRDKAEAAFQMGINVLYYAFTHYLDVTHPAGGAQKP
jgi:hypothetical protein